MTLRSKVTQPFQAVIMDTVGPVHRSKLGKLYIHVCVDFFSKYLIAWPSASIDAATTAKGFYEHVIAVHGVPQKRCTDNGTSYTGQIFRDACKQFGVAQVFSSSWHPQSQGLVERANQTIIAGLRTFVDKAQDNWDVYLLWRNWGFPTLGYMPLTLFRQRCLRSFLDTLDLPLGLDCCNFPSSHVHEYSYSPLVAGFHTNFQPIRAKRWRPPPTRMRGEPRHFRLAVKIH